MSHQIIVPLDGSPLAERILPCATALASAIRGALLLIRVVAPGRSRLAFGEPALAVPDAGRRAEAAEVADATTYLADITRRMIATGTVARHRVVVADDVATAIVQCVPRAGDATIAMATHGRSGMSHWLMGSVAEQVLRCAPVPLLLVRAANDPVDPVAYRTIVVPLDGSAFAEQALALAERVAAAGESQVLLVSVAPPASSAGSVDGRIEPLSMLAERDSHVERSDDYLQRQVDRLRHAGVAARAFTLGGDPAPAIVRFSADHDADLIVMATHGRSGLRRLLMGSVAQGVIGHARQPILLLRPASPDASRPAA